MLEAIKNFPKQFEWEPTIENSKSPPEARLARGGQIPNPKSFLVIGMGGSHLAADLLKSWRPDLDLMVWSSYGLPEIATLASLARDDKTQVIAFSHSGGTEETIDGFNKARERGLPTVAISMGGKLLQQCKEVGLPYIQLPNQGLQPRSAVGHHTRALLKFMGLEGELAATRKLAASLKPEAWEGRGQDLAKKLKDKIPLIYASNRNWALAENWKIRINETGKAPAFYNVFPELNHNEMIGFTGEEPDCYQFVFLRDPEDHPRILQRMAVMKKLFEEKKFAVEVVDLAGASTWEKIFNNILLADWTTYYLAQEYGVDPEKVELVEEFKKLI